MVTPGTCPWPQGPRACSLFQEHSRGLLVGIGVARSYVHRMTKMELAMQTMQAELRQTKDALAQLMQKLGVDKDEYGKMLSPLEIYFNVAGDFSGSHFG